MSFKKISLSIMIAFMLFSIAPASDVMLSDDQMAQLAESIVIGTVGQTVSHWDADHGNIVTDVTFSVERRLKGTAAPQLTFTLPGGQVGDLVQEVSDSPQFFTGERMVLFLQSGDSPVVGGQQGKLLVVDHKIVDRNMPLDQYLAHLSKMTTMQSPSAPTPGLVLPLSPFEYEEAVMPAASQPERKTQDESLLTRNQVTATSTLLTEGFDSGFPTGAWVTSALANGHTFDDESFKPCAGSYSAWCAGKNINPAVDNYANSMTGWMKWGPFDLSDASSAQMTFYLWLESESGYDYIKWGSSIDGNVFSLAKTSGTTSGWMQLTLNLSSRLGAGQVWIAFCFTSSTANTFKGAFIDDVVVSKVVADAGAPLITAISPGKASAGTGAQVTISGSNFGATQGTGVVEFFYRTGQPKISAPVISWSNTAIVCEVPVATVNGYSASAASGPVTVRNNAGQTSLGYNFIVSFGYGLRKWNSNNVRFYINENNTKISGEGAAVKAAAYTWTTDGAADFSFTYAGATGVKAITYNSKNEILWVSLGTTGPIARATTWYSNDVILENDIALNLSYAWGIGAGSFYDVETICLHEFGHWLNLRDLYGDIGDSVNDRARVMYGFGYTNTLKRDITVDDQAGILYIYGPKPLLQAIIVPRGIELSWQGVQKMNIAGYELQRRTNDDAWQAVASFATNSELAQNAGSAGHQFTDSCAPRCANVSYRLRAVQLDGTTESWSETSVTTTAINITSDLPARFALNPAYPNPFNPTTTIAFDLPGAGAVTVTVYDVIGRQVDVLLQETLPAGRHQQAWDAANFPSGVYFIQIQTEGFTAMQRVMLLK